MRSLTIRLPDDTAARLKDLARSRGQSMNKLIEELSAQALAAWDTENHFLAQLDLVAVAQVTAQFGARGAWLLHRENREKENRGQTTVSSNPLPRGKKIGDRPRFLENRGQTTVFSNPLPRENRGLSPISLK